MDKETFIEKIKSHREAWESALAEIGPDRMNQPGVAGDWSVKDLIAHVTWSEREMVGILQTRLFQGSDLWLLPQDERNAAVYEMNRHRPLAEVVSEAQEIHDKLIRLIEQLENQDLQDPNRFPGMPSDWVPWDVLAGNTYRHYQEHTRDLRTWIRKQ